MISDLLVGCILHGLLLSTTTFNDLVPTTFHLSTSPSGTLSNANMQKAMKETKSKPNLGSAKWGPTGRCV